MGLEKKRDLIISFFRVHRSAGSDHLDAVVLRYFLFFCFMEHRTQAPGGGGARKFIVGKPLNLAQFFRKEMERVDAVLQT